jgi:hypothetical protein
MALYRLLGDSSHLLGNVDGAQQTGCHHAELGVIFGPGSGASGHASVDESAPVLGVHSPDCTHMGAGPQACTQTLLGVKRCPSIAPLAAEQTANVLGR